MSNYSDKLRIGWERLQKAGNDAELLGCALVSFHGALADYFRDWLAANSAVEMETRYKLLDRQVVNWQELIDLMQHYGNLNYEARSRIFNANRLCHEVAHGNRFGGTRADVEEYGKFVQKLIANPYAVYSPKSNATSYMHTNAYQVNSLSEVLREEINRSNNNPVLTSYLLCAVGFVGIGGLHRLYNGKIFTGFLWLFSGGLFGVGQFVDLFLIPRMVEDYEQKLRDKAGLSPLGVPLHQPVVATSTYRPSGNQLIVKLIEAAERNGGTLTVTQGVKATGVSFAEVEKNLKEMFKSGYVRIDNDPITGAVTYHFHEL
ncbi:TM2 domain-containing protein [Calothrix sp. NIES-2100]|nr:TM2 domain-containing protein [Calothrix sp. NIES-2100]